MTQVCHTAGLWDYLPSFLQRAASPIVELLVDDMRGALYARTANSEVQPKLFWVPKLVAAATVAMLPADDADMATCTGKCFDSRDPAYWPPCFWLKASLAQYSQCSWQARVHTGVK
jgi:hypothetical protein